ncbi:MAG: type II secretion system protein [Pseudomonadota bacterium]
MYAKRKTRGFSLAELIVAIIILSVGLLGIFTALRVSNSKSADPLRTKQAMAIAEALLEEVLNRPFRNYDAPNFVNANIGGQLVFPANPSAYQTAISFNNSSAFSGISSDDALRVDVFVRSEQDGAVYQLTGYRFYYD